MATSHYITTIWFNLNYLFNSQRVRKGFFQRKNQQQNFNLRGRVIQNSFCRATVTNILLYRFPVDANPANLKACDMMYFDVFSFGTSDNVAALAMDIDGTSQSYFFFLNI